MRSTYPSESNGATSWLGMTYHDKRYDFVMKNHHMSWNVTQYKHITPWVIKIPAWVGGPGSDIIIGIKCTISPSFCSPIVIPKLMMSLPGLQPVQEFLITQGDYVMKCHHGKLKDLSFWWSESDVTKCHERKTPTCCTSHKSMECKIPQTTLTLWPWPVWPWPSWPWPWTTFSETRLKTGFFTFLTLVTWTLTF